MIKSIESILVTQKLQPSAGSVVLRDKDSLQKVTLLDVPVDSFVVRLPSDRSHLRIVNKNKQDYNKSCDYIIFTWQSEKLDVYFIELKKTLSDTKNTDAYTQIIATLPILEYLIKMVEIHHAETARVKCHFVVIAEKIAQYGKQKLNPKMPVKIQYKKRNFSVIYSTRVPFKSLKQVDV